MLPSLRKKKRQLYEPYFGNFTRRVDYSMKRILACVLTAALLVGCCLTLTSCNDDDATGIFYPVSSLVSSLDPQIAALKTERAIVLNCFEGLVRVNEDGTIGNGAARSYSVSPDGLTYTFNLRENVKWHITDAAKIALKEKLPEDFAPFVTAKDFVFALRRAVSAETASPDAYLLGAVENAGKITRGEAAASSLGVRAIDEYTLEIKLEQHDENLLYVLADAVSMPCNEEFFNATGGRYGLLIKYLLSNGPFFLSVLNDASWRMNASSDYSGESAASLPYVWLYYCKTPADKISGITSGSYTAAVLDEYEKGLLGESSEASLTASDNVTTAFVFNHSSDVFKNENIRRAFCLATDAAQIAGLFSCERAESFIPASCEKRGSALTVSTDSGEALTVLRKGLEELSVDSVSVNIYVSEGAYQTLNEYLQIWQSTLGVNFFITLTSVSASQLEDAVSSGKCDAAFYPLTGTASGTRGFLMSLMSDNPKNPLRLGAGAFELTMLRSSLLPEDGRKTLEGVAVDILTEDCSIFPVMHQNTYIAANSGLSGIYSPYANEVVFFARASFTEKKG